MFSLGPSSGRWELLGLAWCLRPDAETEEGPVPSAKQCPCEIKRHLLPGRKAMTNLDNILKSRAITLPTKVCSVKAMVFPAVMYGFKCWTMKKADP